MEQSLHEASTVPASQVAVSGAKVLGMGWYVGEEIVAIWAVGLVVRQGHGNMGLLDENKVYDWASFEWEEIATWALPFKYI